MKRPTTVSISLSLAVSFVICSLSTVLPIVARPSAGNNKITFKLKDAALWIEGKKAFEDDGEYEGDIIWFSLPKQGQFIFSLEPHQGYDFQQIATLSGKTISFSLEGKFYQLVASAPVLNNVGDAKLWLWHDKGYQPDGCENEWCVGSASPFGVFLEHRKDMSYRLWKDIAYRFCLSTRRPTTPSARLLESKQRESSDKIRPIKTVKGNLIGFQNGDCLHAIIKKQNGKDLPLFIWKPDIEYFLALHESQQLEFTYEMINVALPGQGLIITINHLTSAKAGKLTYEDWWKDIRSKYSLRESRRKYQSLIEK
jgi:hypothetical protein